jgi:hypothetical protein
VPSCITLVKKGILFYCHLLYVPILIFLLFLIVAAFRWTMYTMPIPYRDSDYC